jgi:hypothetical protein
MRLVMPEYKRQHDVSPWGGTTDDIAALAQQASELRDRSITERDRHQAGLRITVERPGEEDSFETPESFRQGITAEPLDAVTDITISAHGRLVDAPLSLYIHFDTKYGAHLMTNGTDRTLVEGAHAQLSAALDKGRRHGTLIERLGIAGLGTGVASSISAGLFVAAGEKPKTTEPIEIVGLCLGALAVLGLLTAGVWGAHRRLVPRAEFFSAGSPTKLQRFTRPAWAVGKWVLGTTGAAVIALVLAKVL